MPSGNYIEILSLNSVFIFSEFKIIWKSYLSIVITTDVCTLLQLNQIFYNFIYANYLISFETIFLFLNIKRQYHHTVIMTEIHNNEIRKIIIQK